jgi:(p)ppGpp synthase/HD superfamily hydrolase
MHAMEIARHEHRNDLYGDKPYFDYHICNVVFRVESMLSTSKLPYIHDIDAIIVAFLHDVHEDHNYPLDMIRSKFGTVVMEAVDAISYRKGKETRQEYYERCKKNKIARYVKIHDITENLTNCIREGNTKRQKYYEHAFSVMQYELPSQGKREKS